MQKVLTILAILFLSLGAVADDGKLAKTKSWTADNGNGTFTNPLFYDEFSDPDVIRVGDDYYLAGTTMHAVPGLVLLHSKDLVNWENISYCFDRFDFDDDAFSLKNGKEIYGQGIWAPCIRYHDGTFYIFSNINGKGLQCYTSKDPKGPWEHHNMQGRIYDLSVLFDDDGKIYAIHGYGEVKCTELKADMSGPVEGTERVIIPEGSAVGEGHHIYKIGGMYYILSADYRPMGRMSCARAKSIYGPYETCVVSANETYGYYPGRMTQQRGRINDDGYDFRIAEPNKDAVGCANIHQGGMLQLPNGEWWSVTMQDFHSIGRTVCLSPITWKDGWPMFGLAGNPGRSPRTWLKPATGAEVTPHAPYERNDDFSGKLLKRIWQWNHNPDDSQWKLKKGVLRLNALPANQLMWARNTLTQRVIGPESTTTVELNASKLKDGDVAGLGNINIPCSWIGIVKNGKETVLRWFDQHHNDTIDTPVALKKGKIWLRFVGDFDNDRGHYAYSTDGTNYLTPGKEILLGYQLVTFQGSRLSLFAFNTKGVNGGFAEFDNFTVEEPMADRSGNIPFGKTFRIINLATNRPMNATAHGLMYDAAENDMSPLSQFQIENRGNGKVALKCADGRYVFIAGEGLAGDVRLTKDATQAEEFMWQDMLRQEFMLLSMKRHLYVGKSPTDGSPYSLEFKGADPARRNGAVFRWEIIGEK
ncbi:MAG: family 43 glycosylhydrolase [Prevotella sp.]|nr:family 43 glycosylhydrolase [Prevotella sp.]MBQ6210370.1 family 43 glycosylhydrolase [Prevotella sp.]